MVFQYDVFLPFLQPLYSSFHTLIVKSHAVDDGVRRVGKTLILRDAEHAPRHDVPRQHGPLGVVTMIAPDEALRP